VKGFRISRRESQRDLTKNPLSLVINTEATPELLGLKSRVTGISGQHESFRRPGSFQSQRGLI